MLWWEAAGEGPREILLLHGWGGAGSGHSWRQMLPHLPLEGLRVVTMDFRGHGRSGPAAGGCTLPQFGADALAVADAAGLRRPLIAAFSMGAKVAQWIAVHHPERVDSLFLMAPLALGPMPLTETLLTMWLRMAREQKRFAEILGAMEQPPVGPEIMRDFFADCLAAGEDVLAGSFRMCVPDGGSDRLARLSTPTLIVGGERDGLMRPGLLRDSVAARIPGARVVTVDAGHQMTLTRGRQLAELLRDFADGAHE